MNSRKLTAAFNKRFGVEITMQKMKSALYRHRISSGRSARFITGNTPHNKGIKGVCYSPSTQFKKGHQPARTQPIGTEVYRDENGMSTWYIKMPEPIGWVQKHRLLYEQHHGPLPKNSVVIFLDSDSNNILIDNLKAVSRAELLQINKNNYKQQPKELKPAILAISQLETAIYQQTRKHTHEQRQA
ncbi:MAG: HNH endonuclease [Methylobacter sp.]|uniref:HNH endonuclease signature motif containing protein n=1 Tax=Methylobacter sp. TaxID=2051955 RepID=UPI0025E28972|nr:HNH endonuclease signature motif containing protein [Methylobacter sp.]MCK9622213.1 HNH endonuclease [Methylobacter sp.]